MTHSYTPGPWEISTTFGSIGAIKHRDGFIAFPCSPRSVNEDRINGESWMGMRARTKLDRDAVSNEQNANARLIAAAPELLGALQALDDYVCNNLSSDYPTGVDVDHDAFKAARAAIAKAIGEQA